MPSRAIKNRNSLRAIDLYGGIGGWSLGLRMAGIDVVASYEWWKPASRTNQLNNRHDVFGGNIRDLKLEELPKNIDIVVGSPPCTQFSFANRGGNGDIEDGLRDIEKFFEIVEYLDPKFWAMENVPRVASILERLLVDGGSFSRFAKLKPAICVVDMARWGLPQARRRCIVGNINFDLLNAYPKVLPKRTLGAVIEALSKETVVDPIYKLRKRRSNVSDLEIEGSLSLEEERINREMKSHHPVYNNMSFPDSLNRPSRTITATCTRVSRESVVILSPEEPGKFRRLTVRERGCLQGFPINYQFYGESYAEKLKMIGNAIPPLFTFYLGQAMVGVQDNSLLSPTEGIKSYKPPKIHSTPTFPDKAGESFVVDRRFRLAIPNLRFKSGVRFELSNHARSGAHDWRVRFFFGNSKNIHEVPLDSALLENLLAQEELRRISGELNRALSPLTEIATGIDSESLQAVWTRTCSTGTHPFGVIDILGAVTIDLVTLLVHQGVNSNDLVEMQLDANKIGIKKVLANAPYVLAGFILGSTTNVCLDNSAVSRKAA